MGLQWLMFRPLEGSSGYSNELRGISLVGGMTTGISRRTYGTRWNKGKAVEFYL
jgi:hypothetical protein